MEDFTGNYDEVYETEKDSLESEVMEEAVENNTQIKSSIEIDGDVDEVESDDGQSPQLPDGVTEAPQDPEHMDLTGLTNYPKWLSTYIKISDDAGEFLGDTATEQEVQALCNELSKDGLTALQNPEEMIARILDVLNRYSPLINQAENTATGYITKYKIRWGMLLIALKELVKREQGKKWLEWFEENFGRKLLRSAQDYMRIAEIPNAIRYAVFGKERLLQIIRQLDETTSEDPIGAFLRNKGVTFNPSEVQENNEIRIQTDIAVAKSQLQTHELGHVPEDKVAAFIRDGYQFKPALMEQMILAEKAGGNLSTYLDELILAGGKVSKPILTPQVKAQTYKNTLSKFLDMTRSAISDTHYLGEISNELITQLKQTVMELETKLTQKADN